MTITRAPGNSRRSKYVESNGVVQLVATADDHSADLKGQTAQALVTIDALPTEAGSAKSRLLNATVYITDIARKDDMQEARMEWVDPDVRVRCAPASRLVWPAAVWSKSSPRRLNRRSRPSGCVGMI